MFVEQEKACAVCVHDFGGLANDDLQKLIQGKVSRHRFRHLEQGLKVLDLPISMITWRR